MLSRCFLPGGVASGTATVGPEAGGSGLRETSVGISGNGRLERGASSAASTRAQARSLGVTAR
jgi:hypothetical protein